MNKILLKSVKKVTLFSLVMAIVLAAAIVVAAVFGVNYAATANDNKTLTITVNSFFYNENAQAVESVCETEFDKYGVDVSYQQTGKMSGDDCEILYVFDAETTRETLNATKAALQDVFAEKIQNDSAWGSAFISVSSAEETLLVHIPVSYFVRAMLAVLLFVALAFGYATLRYKWRVGVVMAVSALLSSVMAAAVIVLTRIPFTTASVTVVAVCSLMTTVFTAFTFYKLRANVKSGAEDDAETLVAKSIASKEILLFTCTLGIALVLVGAIATTAVRWFALTSLVGLLVSAFVGLLFAPAMYLPFRQAEEKKKSNPSGYVGAKKSTKDE